MSLSRLICPINVKSLLGIVKTIKRTAFTFSIAIYVTISLFIYKASIFQKRRGKLYSMQIKLICNSIVLCICHTSSSFS